ncbi:hypothetical protein SPI_03908 [Niveomyces insectorum RCEF 264]|uniref:P-loop containing nucleoside triphosphate hydrolase protein n=1 Tax=Niveomyces insectorum RCEF 264 TaxID=1081102 RepID=A0A167WG15_9HYPO|nr:hypothetical protein SPI_03908 [Niveomyces insectorum RCEF 264]
MSLLRLTDVQPTGHIRVDGIDLDRLPLAAIRERAFVTVSQDPFILPNASLRFHLDPTLMLPGVALMTAIIKVGLQAVFLLNSYNGDDCVVEDTLWDRALSSFPALSAGQAQLLSLARALLQIQTRSGCGSNKRRPIILLDEITASLDTTTEATVHDVVEDVFVKGAYGEGVDGHTVLIVTHHPGSLVGRLRKGRDIMVRMGNGKVERVENI